MPHAYYFPIRKDGHYIFPRHSSLIDIDIILQREVWPRLIMSDFASISNEPFADSLLTCDPGLNIMLSYERDFLAAPELGSNKIILIVNQYSPPHTHFLPDEMTRSGILYAIMFHHILTSGIVTLFENHEICDRVLVFSEVLPEKLLVTTGKWCPVFKFDSSATAQSLTPGIQVRAYDKIKVPKVIAHLA